MFLAACVPAAQRKYRDDSAACAQVSNCRAFGANVIIRGAHIGEAKEWALTGDPSLASMTYINGYDDPEIIAGTGTM